MRVVDSRMQRYRSSRADIVVRVLEDELLKLGRQPLTLVENALVVDGASCTLDGDVGAEIEVELERMGAAGLYQSTGKRVAVAVALARLREEADMVALTSNDDGELGDLLAAQLLETFLHVVDLFLENGGVLALAHAISNVENTLRRLALANLLHPVLGHESEVVVDVGGCDHLHAITVGLNLSPVLGKVDVGGYGDGGEGRSLA